MAGVQTSMIFVVCSLFGVHILFSFFKFLHKLCWKPVHIQNIMKSQGIKGPSYRFFYGNTREMLKMKKESMSRPMEELSHHILPKLQPHFHFWINKYGRSFLFWYGPRAQFVTIETEFVKEILNNKEKAYSIVDAEGYIKKILGDGLVTAKGEKWAKLRKIANHAFHAENLKNMTPAMIVSVEMMLERWKQHEGKEIEVYEEFKLLTSEVISRTAFGSSYIQGKDIFEKLTKLTFMMSRNAFKIKLPGLSNFFKSCDEIESNELEQGIRDSIIGIIKKKEKKMIGREVDKLEDDYLGLLMKANHGAEDSYKLTVDDIVDNYKTFYLAGHQSTTSLLAWIFLLGIHIDWQEKARQEVFDIFGQQKPNSYGISRMKTMNMIINETLRLYAPVASIKRQVKHEAKLAGELNLPANTTLIIPVIALHHDTRIWGDDADLFKPQRFCQGIAMATNKNPTAFLPFGLGPRTCIGYNFAANEAKIALSMILQRYSFSLSPSYIHSPIKVLTVQPEHGVQVYLHPL